jgi:hypothetical protein
MHDFVGQAGATQVQVLDSQRNVITEFKADDLFLTSMPRPNDAKHHLAGVIMHPNSVSGRFAYMEIAFGDVFDPTDCKNTQN